MEQEENLLVLTEIISSLEYDFKNEVNTSFSSLPLYTSSLSTPLFLTLSITI